MNVINKYNWKGKNYPSEKDSWKQFEQNNLTIALNDFYAKKYPAYVSIREKQVIILMIPNSKKVTFIIKRNNVKTTW